MHCTIELESSWFTRLDLLPNTEKSYKKFSLKTDRKKILVLSMHNIDNVSLGELIFQSSIIKNQNFANFDLLSTLFYFKLSAPFKGMKIKALLKIKEGINKTSISSNITISLKMKEKEIKLLSNESLDELKSYMKCIIKERFSNIF